METWECPQITQAQSRQMQLTVSYLLPYCQQRVLLQFQALLLLLRVRQLNLVKTLVRCVAYVQRKDYKNPSFRGP